MWAAVAVFLCVAGTSVYVTLRNPTRWEAECLTKPSPIRIVLRSGMTTEQSAKQFAARSEKIGHTCTVKVIRK
jgi:hypothetical protein